MTRRSQRADDIKLIRTVLVQYREVMRAILHTPPLHEAEKALERLEDGLKRKRKPAQPTLG